VLRYSGEGSQVWDSSFKEGSDPGFSNEKKRTGTLGARVQSLRFSGSEFRPSGFGFRVEFRVGDLGRRV
jgi:hypothetical protein